MSNSDIDSIKEVVEAIAKTNLTIRGDISGSFDTYELVTYIDEVVVLDSLGQEVVTLSKSDEDD